ncbi:hypothetical protein [Paraliomyxa miuraensis]|uniref:hypothetical protein n=1 Tax=Paraliomyxa miuraensis TaxID=376150 RepID=UPI00225715F5|nr:hypothetical protein [Paraliomyxa miuraensis]MCX4240477.1 hypothetical protein [Paraliomyxa miuraensis]
MHTNTARSLRTRLQWVALVASFGIGAGCAIGDDDGDIEGFGSARMVEVVGDSTCVPLYAGQTIDAGSVCVSIDNTVDTSAQCGAGATGVMNVTYQTTGGWEIVEAHLAVGDELSDIPANKKGNPQIGHFPYASGASGTSRNFAVPLCELDLDGADTACDPVNAYLAAHAAVRKAKANGTYQNETAWGDGERIVTKGSWAEYFNMTLECKGEPEPPPPPKAQCETAFALAGNGQETCFIGADFDGDGVDDDISRWGWTNGPILPGTSMQWPVYAAAGQCDLGRGELVGHLTVSYDGATANIAFDRVGDYVLDEEHLYIGSEPLPRDVNGEYTVAPGQYPLVDVELGGAAHTSRTVGNLDGSIYVVYHAVACGSFEGGGDDGEGGDGGSEPDPLASLGDEFDGDLSSWDVHHPQDANYGVSDGELFIEPNGNTVWYYGNEAFHLNKTVEGDFMMTAFVEVTNLAGEPTAPGDPYRIGGIMVRDPLAPNVNSYHMGIGNMTDPVVNIVSKSTDDSVSQIGEQPWQSTIAEMRICRVGADVQGLIRLPGDSWRIIDWHVRPDLPQTLVTGPISYAYTSVPDVRTTCDYVRYETVSHLTECMKN